MEDDFHIKKLEDVTGVRDSTEQYTSVTSTKETYKRSTFVESWILSQGVVLTFCTKNIQYFCIFVYSY